jgi:hypothetical protein
MCEVAGHVFVAGRIEAPQFLGADFVAYPQGTTGLDDRTREMARPLIAMPTGGDASYPDLTSTGPGKLVMSYYPDVA